jgi:FixJ family two-component response regulator
VHFFLEKPFTLTSLATAVSDALAGVVDSRPALPAS